MASKAAASPWRARAIQFVSSIATVNANPSATVHSLQHTQRREAAQVAWSGAGMCPVPEGGSPGSSGPAAEIRFAGRGGDPQARPGITGLYRLVAGLSSLSALAPCRLLL